MIRPKDYQCELRSDVNGKKWNENVPGSWTPTTFVCGDSVMCEEDWSLWRACIDGFWREMT